MSEHPPVESGPDPNDGRYAVTLGGQRQLLTVTEILAATETAVHPRVPPSVPPAQIASAVAAVLAVAATCQAELIERLSDPIAPIIRPPTIDEILAARQRILDEC